MFNFTNKNEYIELLLSLSDKGCASDDFLFTDDLSIEDNINRICNDPSLAKDTIILLLVRLALTKSSINE